jgi:glycosyltransferase involved in cell wall biosynthesis
MERLLKSELANEEKAAILRQVEEKYNWERIADQTIAVYEKVLSMI